MPAELLSFQPTELKFPFELKKQIACSLQLKNHTDVYVAFKVKTTSPKKYSVRPNAGFVPPNGIMDITITMQAQRDYPQDLQQCKDKFLVQSVRAPDGAQLQEVSQELFNKENGTEVFENKLKVIYVSPPQPPSPVPESAEETGSPTKADNGDWIFSLRDAPKNSADLETKILEARASLTALSNERDLAKHQNQQLEQELANAKASSNHPSTSRGHGYSLFFVFFVGILGVLVDLLIENHRKNYLIRNPTVVSTVNAIQFFSEQDGSKYCKAARLKSMRNTLGPHQVNQQVLQANTGKVDEFARNVLRGLPKGVPVSMMPELKMVLAIANLVCDELESDPKMVLAIANLVCDELESDPNNSTTKTVLNDTRTLTFCTYFTALQARKRLRSFFERIIWNRRSNPTVLHDDLLQTLLDSKEDGKSLSMEEVIDNCIACLFAGHHTAAQALVWVMKLLNENQKVLEELKEEQQIQKEMEIIL